jgi:hypothetical protein
VLSNAFAGPQTPLLLRVRLMLAATTVHDLPHRHANQKVLARFGTLPQGLSGIFMVIEVHPDDVPGRR